jgi:hypothetical protein
MVWNLIDKSKFTAEDIALPEMSVRPYVQYGIGLQKRWGDRFTGYFQAMARSGGRNGVAMSAGFRWAIGKNYEEHVKSGLIPTTQPVKKTVIKQQQPKTLPTVNNVKPQTKIQKQPTELKVKEVRQPVVVPLTTTTEQKTRPVKEIKVQETKPVVNKTNSEDSNFFKSLLHKMDAQENNGVQGERKIIKELPKNNVKTMKPVETKELKQPVVKQVKTKEVKPQTIKQVKTKDLKQPVVKQVKTKEVKPQTVKQVKTKEVKQPVVKQVKTKEVKPQTVKQVKTKELKQPVVKQVKTKEEKPQTVKQVKTKQVKVQKTPMLQQNAVQQTAPGARKVIKQLPRSSSMTPKTGVVK